MNKINKLLNANSEEAKQLFFTDNYYSKANLPYSISFSKLLKIIDSYKLDRFGNFKNLLNEDNLNYPIFFSKSNRYDWRKYQLLNPILYVSFVNLITNESNWVQIKNLFINSQHNKIISNPLYSNDYDLNSTDDKGDFFFKFEKLSLRLSLQYKYLLKTDIYNFYPSIYTHSISWALHTKKIAKEKRNDNYLLGNQIDSYLMAFQGRQTNGMPEGNVLSDLLSEILLLYCDNLVYEKLSKYENLKILRFRDDYRIYSNDISLAEVALKELSLTLSDLNLKINTSKTSQIDVIFNNLFTNERNSLFTLIDTYKISEKTIHDDLYDILIKTKIYLDTYPNSSYACDLINKIFIKLVSLSYKISNIDECTAILISIFIDNPKVSVQAISLLGVLIKQVDEYKKNILIDSILKKVKNELNSTFILLWLSRAIGKNQQLDQYILKENNQLFKPIGNIWNFSWLNLETKSILSSFFELTYLYDKAYSNDKIITIEEINQGDFYPF